ncbi:CBS domain-containing protein [Fulvivirga sedimenti]|uniref:CBS domain-containing protein n=1 Tax=Fulvivirga sedimenti TaxID=2879465 RepID=A0A9X1HMW2_9BACT|nr:CBS domain-containing protein [Fulvivirga sedimenti]MCA6074426.1 CBS domain-containing protein [Fulvivirga sedimenti]
MTAEELINHMIPPLKMTDDAHKAIIWMEELRCNQLPVIDQGKFIGLLSEELILEENDIEKVVGDFELMGQKCVVKGGSHFYEVLKLASEYHVQTVGVVDEAENYIGAITVQDTITAFAQSAAVQLPGGIIVLSVNQIDYSLAQMSRLVEENNAKILSSSVKIDELDPNKLKVTIKINRLELNHIVATFERFGYKIIARFQETNIQDEERDRLDMLLKYLDI